MTAQEFERHYAQRSRVSLERIRSLYRIIRCHCGRDYCQGWRAETSASQDEIRDR